MKKGLLGKFKAFKKKKSDDVGDVALETLDENKRDDIDGDAEESVETEETSEPEPADEESYEPEIESGDNAIENVANEKAQLTSEEELDEEIYRRIALKHVERQRRKHRKKHYFLRFVVLLCIGTGVFLFLKSSYFNIKSFSVEGNSYYTDAEIISMAKAKKGVNLIFDAGLSDIKKNLKDNPYFEDIYVKRSLPDKLVISIKERRQTAAIVYGESFVVIDENGIVLRKATVDPQVTLLTGLTISKMNIGEKVEVEEADALKMTLRMLSAMNKGDLFFKKINVSKVLIRAYIYDTLSVKGTPKELMQTIQRGELQKVVNNLFNDKINRGTIKVGGSDYMSFTPEIDA